MRPGNMSEPGDRIHLDLPLAAGVAVHSLPPLDAQAGLFVYGLIKFHGAAARHRARDQHHALELPGHEGTLLQLIRSSGPKAAAPGEAFMRWFRAAEARLQRAFPRISGYIIEPLVLMAWENVDARG